MEWGMFGCCLEKERWWRRRKVPFYGYMGGRGVGEKEEEAANTTFKFYMSAAPKEEEGEVEDEDMREAGIGPAAAKTKVFFLFRVME